MSDTYRVVVVMEHTPDEIDSQGAAQEWLEEAVRDSGGEHYVLSITPLQAYLDTLATSS